MIGATDPHHGEGPTREVPPPRAPRPAGRREPPLWLSRLRWRLRGETARNAFVVAVLIDAALLWVLPISGEGATPVGAILLAGFVNLALLVAGGALGARALRRHDPSLPRVVARDRAAAYTMILGAVALCAGGILHRPALDAQSHQVAEVVQVARQYAQHHAPATARAADIDVRRYSSALYRACVPTGQTDRAYCTWVRTDGDGKPSARPDQDMRPNDQVGGLLGPRPEPVR